MPFDAVMGKFGAGKLHSGSKTGPSVKNPKQAIAVMLSEKQQAQDGKSEYQSGKKSGAMAGLKRAVKG